MILGSKHQSVDIPKKKKVDISMCRDDKLNSSFESSSGDDQKSS